MPRNQTKKIGQRCQGACSYDIRIHRVYLFDPITDNAGSALRDPNSLAQENSLALIRFDKSVLASRVRLRG
ncbi:hypothetical protein GCM10011345_27770 [Gemmobacter megaterium]|nr:hypothetical protein GCM10011345_27770 [Gemmobacter megaterium]